MKASQLEILPNIEKRQNEKKSRLLTLIFLVLTVIPSFVFWFLAGFREGKVKLFNPWSLVKLINLSEVPLPMIESGDLSVKLSRWAAEDLTQLPGEWSVRVELLEENFSWGVKEEEQFTAASLIKLPIVTSFFYQVEKGKLKLEDGYVLKDQDKVAGAGSLQYRTAGTKITLEHLATLALSESDNTAAKILRNLIGDSVINQLMVDWEMTGTSLEDNLTTAKDMALFFRELYSDRLVSEQSKEKIFKDLTKTAFEERIPKGVPEGIRVVHKVGNEIGVVSDAGIVFTPGKPFILVILSQKTKDQIAHEKFPELASGIYWLLVGN